MSESLECNKNHIKNQGNIILWMRKDIQQMSKKKQIKRWNYQTKIL